MKLYTEEQVKMAISIALYDDNNTESIVDRLTPIELPSYDQIKYTAKNADKSKCKHFRREQTIEQVYDSFEEGFIAGAKWQAEQMYSVEEVKEIIAEAWLSCEDNEGETFTEANKRILEKKR